MDENSDSSGIKAVEDTPENDEKVILDKMKATVPKTRPKRSKPGFHLNTFNETSYYFKDGLRYVYPYPFTFTAYVKKRWLNLTVLDLFRKEFHMETMEYYEKAIIDGKIKVNNKPVTAEKILLNNDILQTMVHRHEPPVINKAIEFLQNDEEMVVINKPPSIPVHPCGRYRHNTIVFILGKEHDFHGLHTIHRIDRLTSGVLMFAKTTAKAKEIENQIHKKRNVEKEYLARVVGKFPDGEITVDEPILTASHKIGVCHVHEEGKTCSTKFKCLSFNGKSSVVSCRPQTGRMHQIRVHLQWLGYPIVNDPIYNHPTAWGERKRKYDIDEVVKELLRTRKDKSYDHDLKTDKYDSSCQEKSISDSSSCNINITDSSCCEKNTSDRKAGDNGSSNHKRRKIEVSDNTHTDEIRDKAETNINDNLKNEITDNPIPDDTVCNATIEKVKDKDVILSNDDGRISYTSLDIGEEYVDKDCTDCKRTWKEPLLSEMAMYLHSLHYKGPDWEYKTSIPEWAVEDWNGD